MNEPGSILYDVGKEIITLGRELGFLVFLPGFTGNNDITSAVYIDVVNTQIVMGQGIGYLLKYF
jgi:hypothetical protein